MTLPALQLEPGRAGYGSAEYAHALPHLGRPRELRHAGGWILERSIPGTPHQDAMGPYPRFCCQDWEGLSRDLRDLQGHLVSLVLVTDPFASLDEQALRDLFPDHVLRYKAHYVVELARFGEDSLCANHRRNVRRAGRKVEVEIEPAGPERLRDWVRLYEGLIVHRGIRGPARFSRQALARQLQVPGMYMVHARAEGRVVGMQLWLRDGPRAYYHLSASDAEGYRRLAAYAMTWEALRFLGSLGVRWADLGAGAGIHPRPDDGLAYFKQGWATQTRPVFLCGRILDRRRYRMLCGRAPAGETPFFPAYRRGEGA